MIKNKFVKLSSASSTNSFYYNPLTPTDNAEDCNIYIESLEWALANKRKIRNIAVSGPYGSGKSSIIQTFIKRCKSSNKNLWNKIFPKYRFFNISLATFKDTSKNAQEDINDEDLQRLIELSILQQLFFHEEDAKIPDSRFKKIKRQKRIKLFSYSLGIIIFLISILYILAPEFLMKFTIISVKETQAGLYNYFASVLSILGLFFVIYKTSRSFIGLSIKKLNINTAEIEIDEDISKSVLNNHLDEIIYFFEVTKYNVVIIEDLDRFGQTEVFTKLREINLLINNSNKVKRDVVFIYAIKDDMFLDKNRAKFFDFIIPIIPVINFSNSGDKLRKIVQKNNYKIKDELLDDLSMFIDDMRILYNIMNEFYIYSHKINDNLDTNKLLSIIVYKNVYPNDFTKLNENDGDLYKTISGKSEYIKSAIAEIENQISIIKSEIKIAEEQKISDLKELRILYLSKVIEKITNGFVGFKVNNNIVSIFDFATEENFNKIKNGKTEYYFFNSYYGRNDPTTFTFNFSQLENEVNPQFTYKVREEFVLNKNKIPELKKEIEKLNDQKKLVQKSKLNDLISKKQITIETDSNRQSDLINILLRNGYIDENYLDYISVFHEGALTKSDYQFLINVKTEQVSEYDFKLNKTDELLKKISEFSFEKEFVLNFDLIDSILINENYSNKKKNLLQQLSDENEKTVYFIDEFIEKTTNIELFISQLCSYWPNIWNYIYSKTMFPDERIDKYFVLIIQHAEIKDIVKIFDKYKQYINNYSNFLNITANKDKLEHILEALKLKFNTIEKDSPSGKLNYLFENNHYALNIDMLKSYLSFKNVLQLASFNTMNYSYIHSTKLPKMIEYIESNIDEYIESVFLELEDNTEEQLDFYITLLNNEELSIELKDKIILKTNTIIEDLDDIDVFDVAILLFKYSKIEPTWENILSIFEQQDNSFNRDVISFLNSIKNAEVLSKAKISTDKNPEGIQIYSKLCISIILNTEIELESYKLITKSIPWWYESFETENLVRNKVEVLVQNNKVNPTLNGYEFLRENFKGTNIQLLEKYFSNYIDKLEQLIIDSDDLELILDSKIIAIKYKFELINYLDDDSILENQKNSKSITKYLLDTDTHKVRESLLKSLVKNKNIPVVDRITLFNKYFSIFSIYNLDDFLISLGSAYAKILNTSKKATLERNSLNFELLENLVRLGLISSISEIEKGLRVNHKRRE